MEIKYDKKADTKYIRLKIRGKIAKTKKLQDWLLFDYTKNGEVLGIEILNASKNLLSLTTVANRLVGYSLVKSISSNGKKTKFLGDEESMDIEAPRYKENMLFVSA